MYSENSNSFVILGHRFSYLRISPLVNIEKVKEGDTIYLSWKDRGYTFVVDMIYTIDKEDTAFLRASSTPSLTLITCTPLLNPVMRLIIFAKLVSID